MTNSNPADIVDESPDVLEPQEDVENSSENSVEDLAEDLTEDLGDDLDNLYLDAFAADIEKADSKEETEDDLENLMDASEVLSLEDSLADISSYEHKNLSEVPQPSLDALDAVIGQSVIGKTMGNIISAHIDPTTKRIDISQVTDQYDGLKLDTEVGLSSFLSSKQRGESQKYVDMLLSGGVLGTQYLQEHMYQEVISPMQDAVYSMVKSYNTYFAQDAYLTPEEEAVVAEVVRKEDAGETQDYKKWTTLLGIGAGAASALRFRTRGAKKHTTKTGKALSFWRKLTTRFVPGLAIGAAVGTAVGIGSGYGVRKWIQHAENSKMSFDQALKHVPIDARTIAEADLSGKLDGLSYEDGKLVSHGYTSYDVKGAMFSESTPIDPDAMRIPVPGLSDLQFQDNVELIHTANMINYVKYKFRGRCISNKSFRIASNGDLEVRVQQENGTEGQWEEAFSGGFMSTMADRMPTLNGHQTARYQKMVGYIYTKNHKGRSGLIQYLESMQIRTPGNVETVEKDERDEDIDKNAFDVQMAIKSHQSQNDKIGQRGNLRAFEIPNSSEGVKKTYKVVSWKTTQIMTELSSGKYKIQGLDIEFETAKDAITLANLTNFIMEHFEHSCDITEPFIFNNTSGIEQELKITGVEQSWFKTIVNLQSSTIVSNSQIDSMYTFMKNNRKIYRDYLNTMKDPQTGGSLWVK